MDQKIKKNFTYAFLAQGISLLVSCLTNLILPKLITPIEFSYWQLFIFYATYIPCLALGLNDGVYLRYGGMQKKDLDFRSIKSQYAFGFVFQFLLAILFGFLLMIFFSNGKRNIIIILVLLYYIVYTSHNFLGYIFQAINETNQYSRSIIINHLFYIVVQVLLMFLGWANVFVLIPFYITGFFISFLYLFILIYPKLQKVKLDWKLGIRESVISIKIGNSLMISNICSMMVLGIGRQIVDSRWGLLTFGKISFSLTLINFALTFISQVGMVLFPALRRLDRNSLRSYYINLTKLLFNFLPLMYILYLPVQYLLKIWLPAYSTSINYLSMILPICFFDSKMNLIGNTFFKVLNKQVVLLKINVVTIAVSWFLCWISAYFFNSLDMLIISLIVAIAFRSTISSLILSRSVQVVNLGGELLDIILALGFITSTICFKWYVTFIFVIIMCFVRYFTIKKGNLIY